MNSMLRFPFAAVIALAMLSLSNLRADTVATAAPGATSNSLAAFFGQSFTTVTAVPETNITFNFIQPGGAPTAVGTGFLLSTMYTGTPANLNSSVAGFLGQATAAGGLYSFGSSLTLLPNTKYYFYENGTQVPAGGVAFNTSYFGGGGFSSTGVNLNYGPSEVTFAFLVTGTPAVSTPDGGSSGLLAMIAFLTLGVAGKRMRSE